MTALLFNRRILALALGFLLVLGLSAIQTLPRLEDPRLIPRQATILTAYPGADAQQVEALVSKPIEDGLRSLAEIRTLASTSRAGMSVVSVTLRDEVSEVTPVWSRVRDKLNDIAPTLPAEAGMPQLDDERGTAYTLLAALVWTAGGEPNHVIMRRYGEALVDRFRSQAGAEHVRLYGAPSERVEIIVDPALLATAGLSSEDVARALAAADVRNPAGSIDASTTRLTVDLEGSFETLDRLRNVTVTGSDGRSLRLGDLAEIRRGTADPPEELALADGQPAVFVGTRMGQEQRVDLWSEQARAVLEDFAGQLPPGLEARLLFDQATYTQNRLGEVAKSLLLGLVIVVAILLLTMGWRSALVVGVALPATALLTLGLFRLVGLDIHQMSVIGMIVALGLMVDNAIVMTNAIRQGLADGQPARQAVGEALRHLALPLAASTITTVLAFMPIVLLPGGAGEFIGPLAMAVIVALVSSYAVALTLVPAVAPLLLSDHRPVLAPPALPARLFRRLIALAVRHPVTAMAAAFALPLIGFASLPTVKVSFFPPVDRDQFQMQLYMPASTAIEETSRIARQMDEVLRRTEGVRRAYWTIGTGAPMIFYNQLGGEDGNAAYAHAVIDTESIAATARLVPQLQQELDRLFPQAQVVTRKYEQGPPFHAPLELRIYGSELDELTRLGQEIAGIMGNIPQVTHVRSLVHQDAAKLRLHVREEEARLVGLDLTSVARQIDGALSGRNGGFLLEETQRMPVVVRFPQHWRHNPDRLAGMPLTSGGQTASGIPLAALAEMRMEPAWSGIQRRNGERLQIVRGYLEANALPSVVMARVEQALAEQDFVLPPGYRLELGGEAEERGQAVTKLLSSVAMLVLLMVATIALTFNSFRRTAIVFLAGIQSLGLGLLTLKLTGHPFSFVIIVGVMGLMGVAINATIIILSALDDSPGARSGNAQDVTAVVTGTVSRHIWSTTLTTVAGLVPLMLTPGDFWPPFAQAVAGGLALSTVIAFIFTPAAYVLLTRGEAQSWQRLQSATR
ncbi:efflux RND transporter permease subunit [Telmatospirillum sp. J64-1]|uniref:efflux RND transporter permease subunit n=1 Tax=Telmatospirillum sp. J64-1 TaxID=2502183 RepID=UPI00115DEC33|nr:efflux RND transporter permease subunit [Telmatospirillum sp. J64-1]